MPIKSNILYPKIFSKLFLDGNSLTINFLKMDLFADFRVFIADWITWSFALLGAGLVAIILFDVFAQGFIESRN